MPTLKVRDLRSATDASIKAVLGKKFPGEPGIIAGFWLDDASVKTLDVSPLALAKDITKRASIASGMRLTAETLKRPGGILVGYIQPKFRKQ